MLCLYHYSYKIIIIIIIIIIYRHTDTHKGANNLTRTSRIKLMQAKLTNFVRAEPSLYKYVSFNI
jgi:hypothetical protein